MATILIVGDAPGLFGGQARLEADGHWVVFCGGGPTPYGACPMLRVGRCPVADAADLIIFACGLFTPLLGWSYRGIHLLRAYRAHPDYGRLPLLVVAPGDPPPLEGSGPVHVLDSFAGPEAVVAAVRRLLDTAAPRPERMIDPRHDGADGTDSPPTGGIHLGPGSRPGLRRPKLQGLRRATR